MHVIPYRLSVRSFRFVCQRAGYVQRKYAHRAHETADEERAKSSRQLSRPDTSHGKAFANRHSDSFEGC